MRSKDWLTPEGTCALLTRRQFRLAIAVSVLSVLGLDIISPLPLGFFYLIPIASTFWSPDTWMPWATAGTAALLLMLGLATTPMEGIDFVVTMRLGGAAVFLSAGWVLTNLRRLLAEAREREAVLRTMFDSEPACLKVLGPGCVLLDMNRAGLAMLGADDIETLRGRSVLPLVVEKQRNEFEQLCNAAFKGESGMLQFEVIGLQGQRTWMETRIAPLPTAAGQVTAILGVSSDITERRRAEEQLRDNEQRLTQAAAIAGLGFFEHDHSTGAIYYSPGARAIFTTGVSQPLSHDMVVEMTHPDDRERAVATIGRSHDPSGDGSMTLQSRIVRPTGEVRHISVKSQTRFDDARRPAKTVGTVFDVTDGYVPRHNAMRWRGGYWRSRRTSAAPWPATCTTRSARRCRP